MLFPASRRICAVMDDEMADLLDHLVDDTGHHRTEVLQRSLNLYAKLHEELNQGGRVILQNRHGALRELVGF